MRKCMLYLVSLHHLDWFKYNRYRQEAHYLSFINVWQQLFGAVELEIQIQKLSLLLIGPQCNNVTHDTFLQRQYLNIIR